MSPLLFQKLKHSAGYIWLVVAAGYLAVSAGQAVIRNYHSQEEIKQLETRLAGLKLEKQRLEALIVYYKTDTFKEKELRRSLLLIRPGERVYALPEEGKVRSFEDELLKPAEQLLAEQAPKSEDPYWKQWMAYVLK